MSKAPSDVNYEAVRQIDARVRVVNQAVVGLENPNNHTALIDVSPGGGYDDRAYILQSIMALSYRGFDVDVRSELIIGELDPQYGHINRCGIRIYLVVTRSTRTPIIKPSYIQLPNWEEDWEAWQEAVASFLPPAAPPVQEKQDVGTS